MVWAGSALSYAKPDLLNIYIYIYYMWVWSGLARLLSYAKPDLLTIYIYIYVCIPTPQFRSGLCSSLGQTVASLPGRMTSLPGRSRDAGVNYVQVAAHLDVMHQDGAIAYTPGFDDPPDGAQITDLGPGIMRLRQLAPGNNVSWKVYKLAILSNMANRK